MSKQVTPETLNSVMEFDHIIRVNEDGTVDTDSGIDDYFYLNVDSNGNDEFSIPAGWTLLHGYTGQYGYNGPVMHPSEFIGGRMATDILSTPGYYVALVVEGRCDGSECDVPPGEGCVCEEPAGWAVAYKPLEA